MSRFLIPLWIIAIFLSGSIAVYTSTGFGSHLTAYGVMTQLLVMTMLLFFLLKFIVYPLDSFIDREAKTKKP